MSNRKLIVSVFAEDRPNLVNEISDQVLEFDGNWLESSLSRLCGQFAGLIHIDIDDENRDDLLEALEGLAEQGIYITEQSAEGVVDDSDTVNVIEIMVEANDRPGIIGEITRTLGAANINIDSLDTGCESASMAGYTLFRAHMMLAMPEGMDEDDLEELIAGVSDDIMISVLEN